MSLSMALMSASISQRSRWRIPVEITVGVDLVADDPDLTVFRVPPGGVDPGVGDVGRDLTIEERFDGLGQRNALGIAQIRVSLRVAVLVPADDRRLVTFGKRREDRLPSRNRKLQVRLPGRAIESAFELGPVLAHRGRHRAQELSNLLLGTCRA
jgi:hypothetical protein